MDTALDSAGAGDPPEAFELERFEWVKASESVALLRVTGWWHPERAADPARALLLATVREELRHFAPLPTRANGVQRAVVDQGSHGIAFPVPLALVVEEDARFSLRPAPGSVVALGAPTQRRLDRPLPKVLPAEELDEWRRHLRQTIADGEDLERRAALLCRAIHQRAGLEELPTEPSAGDLRPKADADLLPALREAVGKGLSRVAALEARLAERERELRSRASGGEESGAGHG